VHQSALLGQGLLWRSLGRSLLANAVRVWLCLGLAAASPSVLASDALTLKKIFVFNRGSSAAAHNN